MATKVVITGVRNLIKAVGEKKGETKRQVADAVASCAEVIYRKSQKLVPRDTEALAESGHIESNQKSGKAATSTIVYGGESAPYALYVHEDMTKHHAAPTCAKFLTKAIISTRGTCTSILNYTLQTNKSLTKDGVEVK